jgi:hypothetical protein
MNGNSSACPIMQQQENTTRFPWIAAIRRLDSESDSRCRGGGKVVAVETSGGGGWGRCGRWRWHPVSKLGLGVGEDPSVAAVKEVRGGEGPAMGGGLAGSRLNYKWAVGGAGGGVSKEEEDYWGKLFIMFNSTTIPSLNIFGHQDGLHFVFQSLEVI